MDKTEERHRVTVTLEFSTRAVGALAQIMRRSTHLSLSDTLEEALLMHYALLETTASGGRVVIEDENGDEFILEDAQQALPRLA